MNIRMPTVAGSFYPGSSRELNNLLDKIFRTEQTGIQTQLAENNIIGGVVPHAGYIFSAYEAVHFFEILKQSKNQYETIVIVNPNHTGYGAEVEVDSSDSWETPLGKVDLDKEFISSLNLPVSSQAQSHEHSAEVMLPFLQKWLSYPYKIAPICILRQNPETARNIAQNIYDVKTRLKRNVLIIASSDFSHYVSPETGKNLDDLVLKEIEKLDSDRLYVTVLDKRISVCGYGPIMTLIEYSKRVADDPKTAILARGNSGKTMPSSSVVDYVSILFYQ